MSRRQLVVAGLAILVSSALTAGVAQGAESVQMRDNRYLPAISPVPQGQGVTFTNFGLVVHDAVDETGLDLFATDIATTLETVSIDPLPGAGSYTYVCTFHPEMTGRFDVPVAVSRGTVREGGQVTVRWAMRRAQGDLVFDVQRRRPGASRFQPWRTSVLTTSTRWWPNARGIWAIRARVRNIETGEHSRWSVPRNLRVRP
jgi:plastocyanin